MSEAEIFSILFLTILVVLVPVWRNYYFFPKVKYLKEAESNKRINFYDFLKGVSIVAVIVIHARFFYGLDSSSENNLFLNLVNNLSRFCIPIFFISSGILLRPWNKTTNKLKFFKLKFLRIFLPYIILVSLMAIYYNIPFARYLSSLATGTALLPFYFIIVLLQLYLVYPLLSKYRKKKYFLLFSFLISFASTLLFDPVAIFGAVIFVKFLFFFAYGMHMRDYYLSNQKLKRSEVALWLTIALSYLLIVIILGEKYYNFRLFYGLAIFNLLYYYRETLSRYCSFLYKSLTAIGAYSLWIFLFHFLIEKEIYRLVINWQFNFYPQGMIYISFILIILFTLLISYLSARIISLAYAKMLEMFDL